MCYTPGTVLTILNTWCPWMLTTALNGRLCTPHLGEKEGEAQRVITECKMRQWNRLLCQVHIPGQWVLVLSEQSSSPVGLAQDREERIHKLWSIHEHPKSRGQRGRFVDQEFLSNLPEYLPWICSPNKTSKDCKYMTSTFSHYLKNSFHIWGSKFACFVFILFSTHNIFWPVRKKKNPKWSRRSFFLKLLIS